MNLPQSFRKHGVFRWGQCGKQGGIAKRLQRWCGLDTNDSKRNKIERENRLITMIALVVVVDSEDRFVSLSLIYEGITSNIVQTTSNIVCTLEPKRGKYEPKRG